LELDVVLLSRLRFALAIGFHYIFPRLVPSITDPAFSLTIYNAASIPRTQTVIIIILLTGVPVVIGYTAYVYRVFKGKVELPEEGYLRHRSS